MRLWIAAVMSAPLCACNLVEDDIARTHERSRSFDTPAAYMTADARIVTQRIHPVTGRSVVCVEPSPDAIRAVASSGNAALKGGNGAVTVGLDLSGTSSEAAAELAGRSTALLGLREGIFRACEAYANGIIGADAYGLILAKYAPTMTTLFLAQDVSGAGSAARQASATAPGGSASPAGTPPAAGDKTPKPAAQHAAAPGLRIWPAAMILQAAGGKAGKTHSRKPGAVTPQPDAQPTTDPTAAAATSLLRMNEDYMFQPQSLIGSLVIACILLNDPSRVPVLSDDTPPQKLSNPFLGKLCDGLDSIENVARFTETFARLESDMRLVEPTGTSVRSREAAK